MSSTALTRPPRRRNGRQQACEPCRRRKVSCGHEVPVCQRCKRSSSANKCIYLIAGRPAEFEPPSPSPSEQPSTAFSQIEESEQAGISNTVTAVASPSSRNYGYLGPTSFSAVFLETQTNLDQDRSPRFGLDRTATSVGIGVSTPNSAPLDKLTSVPDTPQTALDVLRMIPDQKTGEVLFRWHVNANASWIRPAAEQMIGTMWRTFGPNLRQHADPSMLREMALQLTYNSNRPLGEDTNPEQWMASFSGKNMRWECLALLFTFWAFGSYKFQLHDVDGLQGLWQSGRDRRKAVLKYKECAATCIQLANTSRNANSLILYTVYRYAVLVSNIVGDAHLEVWKLHAETIAMLTFLGMHAEPSNLPYKPSAMSEAKRRILCGAFKADKQLATISGRPPLLVRTFVSTPLPLDLSDETLLAGGAVLDTAVRNLDSNGWNTEGKILPVTMLRARTMLSCIRDAILEIALKEMQDVSTDVLLNLRNRELETIQNFPRALVFDEGDIKELLACYADDTKDDDNAGAALYAKLVLRLEHMQNMFFLERLLLKKHSQPSTSLLTVSLDIISLTLDFWMYKSRLYDLHGDLDCLVLTFAAPASGILCQQLKSPIPHNDPKISRSSIIQKLSQLLGFLDFISPTDANGSLCHNVKSIIQQVIDQELSNTNGPSLEPQLNIDNTTFAADWNDFQFAGFDLLDTFDWVRPDVTIE